MNFGGNMNDLKIVKKLMGNTIKEKDLSGVEYFVNSKLGLFMPGIGNFSFLQRENLCYPSYMVVIYFDSNNSDNYNDIELSKRHYLGEITVPYVKHSYSNNKSSCYYCIMIDKVYFEEQFKLYENIVPDFSCHKFVICSDILKALNTFAFEYSKGMKNSCITLDAQSTIITHWIIRSILGETYDVRSISSNYAVGRVQQHIEQHFGESITVGCLAELAFTSESTLNRLFKQETGLTPFEYLIETRVAKAKIMLKRKDISISNISFRCGFNSNSHFTSCFKRITGASPSEYRKGQIEGIL